MEINELLKDRQIEDPIKKFTAELLSVYEGTTKHELVDQETAEIGLRLLNKFPGTKKQDDRWTIIEPFFKNQERYQKLLAFLPEAPWENEKLKNLLVYFFGAEKAEYVAYAWEQMRFQMYQTGYARRSFRSPHAREMYFINQLNFLISVIPQVSTSGGYPKYLRTYYDLSVTEQLRYGNFLLHSNLFRVWSAAIDLGNREILQQAEDIIFNKDEIGKVTRDLIKALLNSNKPEAWELIEKLLLAAQRQEGLRQTILETLDETSAGALVHLINVVISNKLTRFSSVVRAVDVWAGLGWESEREKTVAMFLEKAREFLENPEKIPAAVKSADNSDVYMALWAQGVEDVEKCAPLLEELYARGNAEKRALALKFAFETAHPKIDLPLYEKALDDRDLMVLAWALAGVNKVLSTHNDERKDINNYPSLFEKIHKIVETIETKEKTFSGKIFAWTNITFSKNDALRAMSSLIRGNSERLAIVLSHFDEMNVQLREGMTHIILKDYAGYSWQENKRKKLEPLTDFQHEFAFRIIADKGEMIREAGFRALENAAFSDEEIRALQNLLKRKGADFRGRVIKLLLGQKDEKLNNAVRELTSDGDAEQRLGGLDLLLQLQKTDRLRAEVKSLADNFRQRKSISQKEEILLGQLDGTEGEGNTQTLSAANGYGIFDPAKSVSPFTQPIVDPKNIYEKRAAKHEYGFSMPFERVKKQLDKLTEIYFANKDYEYEVDMWNGSKQTVLLGNMFRNKKYHFKFETPEDEFRETPLGEVWEKWFQESKLDEIDLHIIELSKRDTFPDMIPGYEKILPKAFKKFYQYDNPLFKVVYALRLIHPFAAENEFMLGGCVRLFASLDEAFLKAPPKKDTYYYGNSGNGWQSWNNYHIFYNAIDVLALSDESFETFWQMAHWRQFSGREVNIDVSAPSLLAFARAYELKLIGADELMRGLTSANSLNILSSRKPVAGRKEFDYFGRFPFLQEMFEKVRERILDIELKRGDSPTAATGLASSINSVYGVDRFVQILTGLGKTALNRGYSYAYGNAETNRQTQFSRLLKNSFPRDVETQKDFDAALKQSKISEKQLIEAAVYAPQWQKFVSRFLNWKGLDAAIWWMHAHTKNAGYREMTAEAESEIAKYTSVDLADFKTGAVDKDWFIKAFKEIGKKRWEIVYDAAKYISDGSGHRRARLYSDVISGKTKIKEVADKVKTKRDQDYLRIYGLVPLNKKDPEKDVLARYAYLQKFKKESRQFGAQKQTSEALASRIALENLARNAGYADPVRLTWAMETKQVQEILSSAGEFQKDGVSVRLTIDAEGKADVLASKGGKELKSVPPKYKKEKQILELNEYKKTLREQFSRSRQVLEEAMTRGDEFEAGELTALFAHPVISKHLEKLVFISGEAHGFYKDGGLTNAGGKTAKISKKARIAHCVDLYESNEWSDYQRFCFDNELKQPFKQIFREYYRPTEDELKEKSVSRRYAGHQIQPAKTVALLKTRGWKVDYEEGLQKVFHKENFAAKMYALADWFSPADVESPTLETVQFQSLKDYKNVPFEEIDARIFSEVMRDIDLVVSVAHAGGVDPEASHSTIEMRSVILRETARLFKLENVSVKGNHAFIKGKMGDYTVHLGSAVVHLAPGKYLSVLPVQSQQRGRLFLPFADDDPKSAEVVSKVLMFARDGEIQDPTILRQIN